MFITYEPWTKTSPQAHEHITIDYRSDGIMLALSREATRSTASTWDTIGYWASDYARFDEDSRATRLVATQLKRHGWTILGIRFVEGEWTGAITVLPSNGRITDPESIRGRVRNREPGNARDKRRKVQGLFGSIGTTNIGAMRAAIVARQKAR